MLQAPLLLHLHTLPRTPAGNLHKISNLLDQQLQTDVETWRKGYLTRMFGLPKTYRFRGLSGARSQILLLRVERLMSPLLSRCQSKSRSGGESPIVADGGRMRTKPLIPELCFATTTEEDSESKKPPATPYLEEDGTSLLISCSNCSIRVHTSQS